jgi:hypothetical protein
MALPTSTTLSVACGANDITLVLASITDIVAGTLLKIDQEIMKVLSVGSAATVPVSVLRGQEGTAVVAHAATVQVIAGATQTNLIAGDWPQAPAGSAQLITAPNARTRRVKNYAAAGAITLPNPGEDMVAIIDGTSGLAMTLANPSKLNDGDQLFIIANGKAAHTVTYSAGVGNGGGTMDVGTYNATEATGCVLMAANGFWVLIANGIGSSGTQVAGVVWA